MGGAIYQGFCKLLPKENILVCDKDKLKVEALDALYSENVNEAISKSDIIVVAVKPQYFESMLEEITVSLENKIIVSIMAGINLKTLQEKTQAKKVVRTMPNLPVQVGKGIVGYISTNEVLEEEKVFIKSLFTTMGSAFEVENENMLDNITALSGSGPAYFFYITELMYKKALDYGFTKDQAREISENTFVGSALLLDNYNFSAEEWKNMVTSKGGTTQAALESMKDGGMEDIFLKALDKSRDRSKELSE